MIIQGDEKTLFMADGMKIKTLNEDGENEQLVDEEGNFVDMDGNIIEIGELPREGEKHSFTIYIL